MAKEITQSTQLTPNMERDLIGAWLCEEHIEHIKLFRASEFPNYSDLFKALASGRKASEIADLNIGFNRTDLLNLSQYSPTMYRQSLEKAEQLHLESKARKVLATFVGEKDLRKFVEEAQSVLTYDSVPLSGTNLVERLEAELEFRRKEKPIKYGLQYLDKLTRGIHRQELTTVAARPGVGKSSFALQVANLTRKCDEKVLYFTLEMPDTQQAYRILMQTNMLSDEDKEQQMISDEARDFLDGVMRSGNLKFYTDNQLSKICAAIHKEKPYLVILDQLTQIKVGDKQWKNRLEELQEITATLKRTAMQENVAIMLLCQINRDAANSEPTLANLKGSGQIEEDSDNVIMLHKLTKNEDDANSPIKEILLKLEKHRSGATGCYHIGFKSSQCRFFEYAKED